MKRPLRVSDEAATEASEAAQWYEARRPGLGREFLVAIGEAFGQVEANPRIGSPISMVPADDVRRVIVRRFPYDVVYIELSDRIQVLAVAHERRHPGYWIDRVRR